MTNRSRRAIRSLTTGALRVYDELLSALPDSLMAEHRAAVKLELLARELPSIADESGGYAVAPVRGQQ